MRGQIRANDIPAHTDHALVMTYNRENKNLKKKIFQYNPIKFFKSFLPFSMNFFPFRFF